MDHTLEPHAHPLLGELVALGFLERNGEGERAEYCSTSATDAFLAYLARIA
jgi:hypothetical protein